MAVAIEVSANFTCEDCLNDRGQRFCVFVAADEYWCSVLSQVWLATTTTTNRTPGRIQYHWGTPQSRMLLASAVYLALGLSSLYLDHSWIGYTLVAFAHLTMLSTLFRKLEFYARSLVYVSGMGFVAFTGVWTSVFMSLIGQRASAPWLVARIFYKTVGPLGSPCPLWRQYRITYTSFTVGVTFRIEGAEHLEEATKRPTVVRQSHLVCCLA